jgi:hypothetical protein
MEAVVVIAVIAAFLLVADRYGNDPRPVLRSDAYREALTGMMREPRAVGMLTTGQDDHVAGLASMPVGRHAPRIPNLGTDAA